jgi:hypothetical protein
MLVNHLIILQVLYLLFHRLRAFIFNDKLILFEFVINLCFLTIYLFIYVVATSSNFDPGGPSSLPSQTETDNFDLFQRSEIHGLFLNFAYSVILFFFS